MTIRELLRAIWNGRWFVLVAVVLVAASSYVYAQKQVPTYRAAVSVQLAAIDDKVAQAAGVQALVTPDMSAVTAPDLLSTAAAQQGVSATNLANRVSASYDAATHRVSIAADAPTPAEAIATVNAVSTAYVAAVPGEIQAQLANIDKQVTDQRNRLTSAQAAIARNASDQFAQADITAAVARYQALSDARSAYQQVSTPARVLAPATEAIPVGLGPGYILSLGILAGLVAGLGVAMAHRGLSNRLRTASEAVQIAKVPVIAELDDVPRAVRTFRARGLLPVAGRAATPYTESIRELRTALRLSTSQTPTAVVVVTATDTAAPRAFIAANLAASWALSGRRTVVVCGDMRRPEIADMLPVRSGAAAQPGRPLATTVPNLSVLPALDSPLDPADYLATDGVRERIEELRTQADIIVIDAPPVLAAADATILSSYADGAVLVTTLDKSDRTVLQAASERLRVSGVTVFGIVLSADRGRRRRSYAGSYGESPATAGRSTSGRPHPTHAGSSRAESSRAEPSSLDAEGTTREPNRAEPVSTATAAIPVPMPASSSGPLARQSAVPGPSAP